MFTGLIEEKGVVRQLKTLVNASNATNITVEANLVAEDAKIGDSIAINGCCLTVVEIESNLLAFQAGSETLSRTNLGQLRPGSHVNLERSIKMGERMGGHYVTGHIDGLATVDQRNDDGEWAEFWFRLSPELTRQMASKGSVAVDGISLTLVDVEPERFSVALIPHTLEVTNLGERTVGDKVNIETDLLAKYVQQQLRRQ
jgi:riboflavin synthase